jgi:hypothetical protein
MRSIILASLTCILSSAAIAQTPPAYTPPTFPGWTSARQHFSFAGITFDFTYGNWGYGAQIETLVDCSISQFFCLTSPTFSIVVPWYCSDLRAGHWSVGGVHTEEVLRHRGPLPIHSARSGTTLYLGSAERPHQLFEYDPNMGLIGLYWDNRNQIWDGSQIDFIAMARDGRLETWLRDPQNAEERERVYFPRTTFDRVGSCR